MPKSTCTCTPILHASAVRSFAPYHRKLAPRRLRRLSLDPRSRIPSSSSEIFVRALIGEEDWKPDGEEAELNVKVEIHLFVDVIPGEEDGCFVDPDTFVLTMLVWSPLPVPMRPLVTAQLDKFVAVDRDIPGAPLWAEDVRATRDRPLVFSRSAHWLRTHAAAALTSMPTLASSSALEAWSEILSKMDDLVLFFRRSKMRRPTGCLPPRPRPRQRSALGQQVNDLVDRMGMLRVGDGVDTVEDIELQMQRAKI